MAGRLAPVREPAPEAKRGRVAVRRAAGGEARPARGRDDRAVAVRGHDGDEPVAYVPRGHGDGDGLGIAAHALEHGFAADPRGRGAGRVYEERGGRLARDEGEDDERERDRRRGGDDADDDTLGAASWDAGRDGTPGRSRTCAHGLGNHCSVP